MGIKINKKRNHSSILEIIRNVKTEFIDVEFLLIKKTFASFFYLFFLKLLTWIKEDNCL